MTAELDKLIETLNRNFSEASRRQPSYYDNDGHYGSKDTNHAIANRQAIGTLALALVEAMKLKRQIDAEAEPASSKLKGLGR